MSRYRPILTGLAVAALAAGSFAATGQAQERGPHPRVAQANWHDARGGRFADQLIQQYDANHDGKLTQEELDKGRADQLAKYDTNHDGKLSLKEYEALWLDAMHEQMVRNFQRHDSDGDALVTVQEFQRQFKDVVARADRNGDNALSRDDFRARDDRGPRRGDDDNNRRGRRL